MLDLEYWAKEWSPEKWKEALRAGDDPEETRRLRLHTSRGRPLASDRLLARLEHKLGRHLRPLPVGRPKRQKDVKKEI